jgi:hypothetical protein
MRAIKVSLVVLFAALLSAPLTAADALVIEKQPWSGAQPQSPSFAPGRSGLDFTLIPATGFKGPTLALLGLARLPGRYAATYRDRIAGALLVVAVDLRTGAFYQGTAEPRNTAPLSALLDSEPSSTAAGAGLVDTYFNLDLRVQLGLPDYTAKYAVLVWLDDLVSPVQIAKTPGEPPTEHASKAPNGALPGIHFGATPWMAGAREGIVLHSDGSRVNGVASPGANLGVLRILSLDFRTRTLVSVTLALPKRENAFDFDLSVLGGYDPNSTGTQKSFLLAGWGTTWSRPLVIDRTRQP